MINLYLHHRTTVRTKTTMVAEKVSTNIIKKIIKVVKDFET